MGPHFPRPNAALYDPDRWRPDLKQRLEVGPAHPYRRGSATRRILAGVADDELRGFMAETGVYITFALPST